MTEEFRQHSERLRHEWHRYIDAKRQLWAVTERCSLRGWPDRTSEIRNAIRLQELFCDQESLRMEHLLATREASATQAWTTLSAISKQIRDEWTDSEEEKLRAGDPIYNELVLEIERCSAAHDPATLEGPFRDARRDPEYIHARQVARDALADCDLALAAGLADGLRK
jgi:hypothetical protein